MTVILRLLCEKCGRRKQHGFGVWMCETCERSKLVRELETKRFTFKATAVWK